MDIPKILVIPILAGFLAQCSKVIVAAFQTGRIDLRLLNSYGGMPSSHTALVVSVAASAALADGIRSTAFAVALIFATIIIRDAIGIRVYLSEHARILNQLIEELPSNEKLRFPRHLLERIGHTPLQAIVGGLIGFIVTIVFWFALSP